MHEHSLEITVLNSSIKYKLIIVEKKFITIFVLIKDFLVCWIIWSL